MVLLALPEAKVTRFKFAAGRIRPSADLTRPSGILRAERPLAGWEACATEQPGWLCYAAASSFNRAALFQRNMSRSVTAFLGAAPSASLSK
jgi:hypothetical protein